MDGLRDCLTEWVREITHDIIYMQKFKKKCDEHTAVLKMDVEWRPTYCTVSAAQYYVTI